jgi:hypothetical protein
MKPPPGFGQLCEGLHQDAPLSSGGALAKHCLAFVVTAERSALSVYLKHISEKPDSELKGVFNRVSTDIGFDARMARAFVDGLLAELRKP